jgi:hypothetical protein
MLNPSKADHVENDPTVRRCIGFAEAWGYGGVDVVNIFALRSTDPLELYGHDDPIGPENDAAILSAAAGAARVVAAWGHHGALRHRGSDVLRLIERSGRTVECLGMTKDGYPRHPLYIRGSVEPVPYAVPQPLVRTPVTDEEQQAIKALRRVSFPPATAHKRFALNIQGVTHLTDKQRAFLWRVVHRFRRQISPAIVSIAESKLPEV